MDRKKIRKIEDSIFQINATHLRNLQSEIHEKYEHRDESSGNYEAWIDTCKRFHSQYDALAFPGGLEHRSMLLKQGDGETIELAVRFLEEDPWFFRSGYIKADIIKHLCRGTLTLDQQKRLRIVILQIVESSHRREFRWYCKLARVVYSKSLLTEIKKRTKSFDREVGRRAQWVLRSMESSVK